MKKIIIISSAVLFLGFGLFLKRQHHNFKKEAGKSFIFFQEMIDKENKYLSEDRISIEREGKDPYYGSSLIESKKELIKMEERSIELFSKSRDKFDSDSKIGFLSYTFTVFPKEVISYFK